MVELNNVVFRWASVNPRVSAGADFLRSAQIPHGLTAGKFTGSQMRWAVFWSRRADMIIRY